jgi:hypothetical protein
MPALAGVMGDLRGSERTEAVEMRGGPNESFITQQVRTAFYQRRRPPANWQVFIALYLEDKYRNLSINQHGGVFDIPAMPRLIKGFIQTSCIGIGNLFAFVYAVESPDLEVQFGEAERYLRRIWPVFGPVRWPPAETITDRDIEQLFVFLRTTKLVT